MYSATFRSVSTSTPSLMRSIMARNVSPSKSSPTSPEPCLGEDPPELVGNDRMRLLRHLRLDLQLDLCGFGSKWPFLFYTLQGILDTHFDCSLHICVKSFLSCFLEISQLADLCFQAVLP